MYLKNTLLLFSLFVAGILNAQQSLPELRKAFALSGEDTNRVKTGNDIGWELLSTHMDSAILYTEEAAALAEKLHWTKGIGFSYNQLGIINFYNSDFNRSLQCYEKAVTEWKRIPDEISLAMSYGNMGSVNGELCNFSKALDYYFLALKVYEKLNKKKGMASNYGNIGTIYAKQYEFDKALNNFFRALNICRQVNDKGGIERNLMNIGTAYQGMKKGEEALKYLEQALAMAEERDDKCDIAKTLGNIGLVYQQQKNYSEEQVAFERGYKLAGECNDKTVTLTALGELGGFFTERGKYTEAEKFLLQALSMSTQLGLLISQKNNTLGLSELYSLMGNDKKALKYYIQYTHIKDSVFTQEKQKEFTRKEMNYEFDKREAELEQEHDKKDLLAVEAQQKQQLIIYTVSAGLLIMLVLALIIYRGYRQKQKANTIILQQKNEVEEQRAIAEQQKKITEQKNKEITDSITYAKRLQNAILPSQQRIKEHLPENFIFYKPKDIVAGDFYWMETVSIENRDLTLFAVADCTGHGVPGAMVSVVCSNALNQSVKEFGLTDPGKILDKTRELVLDTFSKADEDVKDGMDISLVTLNGTNIRWAGANNPLWIVKANHELIELKGHKQAIGKTEGPTSFPTHELRLEKGDMLYLITDGIADQFGGPKGKKFKYQQLKDLLLSIHTIPVNTQKEILSKAFEEWKGDLEQVDDTLVVGLRL